MPATDLEEREITLGPTATRFGYVVAMVVNAIGLIVVNNILHWDLLRFLTDDFNRVIPLLNVSLAATILVNAIYLAYHAAAFKSLTQIGLLTISMAVTVRIFQVFPFDFSPGGFHFGTALHVVLILTMVAIAMGIAVEIGKLAGAALRREATLTG